MREGKGAPRRGWTTARIMGEREQLNPIFDAARSWRDLEARLAEQKRALEKKGQGLVITDGEGEMKLSALGTQVRLRQLETKFEQRWEEHDRGRPVHHPVPNPTREARQELADAQAGTDMAYALHRMGLVDRKQLDRSLAERERAEEEADSHKSFAERIRDQLKEQSLADREPKLEKRVDRQQNKPKRRDRDR